MWRFGGGGGGGGGARINNISLTVLTMLISTSLCCDSQASSALCYFFLLHSSLTSEFCTRLSPFKPMPKKRSILPENFSSRAVARIFFYVSLPRKISTFQFVFFFFLQ